ncbi:sua1 [Scenedesmus sp. PABB004]|nr:sua1 [Scenedesmus sp. PABB004]
MATGRDSVSDSVSDDARDEDANASSALRRLAGATARLLRDLEAPPGSGGGAGGGGGAKRRRRSTRAAAGAPAGDVDAAPGGDLLLDLVLSAPAVVWSLPAAARLLSTSCAVAAAAAERLHGRVACTIAPPTRGGGLDAPAAWLARHAALLGALELNLPREPGVLPRWGRRCGWGCDCCNDPLAADEARTATVDQASAERFGGALTAAHVAAGGVAPCRKLVVQRPIEDEDEDEWWLSDDELTLSDSYCTYAGEDEEQAEADEADETGPATAAGARAAGRGGGTPAVPLTAPPQARARAGRRGARRGARSPSVALFTALPGATLTRLELTLTRDDLLDRDALLSELSGGELDPGPVDFMRRICARTPWLRELHLHDAGDCYERSWDYTRGVDAAALFLGAGLLPELRALTLGHVHSTACLASLPPSLRSLRAALRFAPGDPPRGGYGQGDWRGVPLELDHLTALTSLELSAVHDNLGTTQRNTSGPMLTVSSTVNCSGPRRSWGPPARASSERARGAPSTPLCTAFAAAPPQDADRLPPNLVALAVGRGGSAAPLLELHRLQQLTIPHCIASAAQLSELSALPALTRLELAHMSAASTVAAAPAWPRLTSLAALSLTGSGGGGDAALLAGAAAARGLSSLTLRHVRAGVAEMGARLRGLPALRALRLVGFAPAGDPSAPALGAAHVAAGTQLSRLELVGTALAPMSCPAVRVPEELLGVRPTALEEYVRARIVQFLGALAPRLGAACPAVSAALLEDAAAAALGALPPPDWSWSQVPVEALELELVFTHDCLALGCNEPQCALCAHNSQRRCGANFAKKYLVADKVLARCGAPVRVELRDRATGALHDAELDGVYVELFIVDGGAYDARPPGDAGAALDAALDGAALLRNKKDAPLLVAAGGGQADAAGRLLLQTKAGRVVLPELVLTDSSEAMLSGRKPPFRLAARARHVDGRRLATRPAVSEPFVVATRRVRASHKVEIPSCDDHVSKLEHMGRETVKKLSDLHAAAAAAGVTLAGLDPAPARIEKVGEFKALALRAEAEGHLRQQLLALLKLPRDKWDEAAEHAKRAVVPDNRMRAWYADPASADLGLLFACRLGVVDLRRPQALLQSVVDASGASQVEVVPQTQQSPVQRDVVRQLLPRAEAAWWAPGHTGWGIFPEDTDAFEAAVGQRSRVCELPLLQLPVQPGLQHPSLGPAGFDSPGLQALEVPPSFAPALQPVGPHLQAQQQPLTPQLPPDGLEGLTLPTLTALLQSACSQQAAADGPAGAGAGAGGGAGPQLPSGAELEQMLSSHSLTGNVAAAITCAFEANTCPEELLAVLQGHLEPSGGGLKRTFSTAARGGPAARPASFSGAEAALRQRAAASDPDSAQLAAAAHAAAAAHPSASFSCAGKELPPNALARLRGSAGCGGGGGGSPLGGEAEAHEASPFFEQLRRGSPAPSAAPGSTLLDSLAAAGQGGGADAQPAASAGPAASAAPRAGPHADGPELLPALPSLAMEDGDALSHALHGTSPGGGAFRSISGELPSTLLELEGSLLPDAAGLALQNTVSVGAFGRAAVAAAAASAAGAGAGRPPCGSPGRGGGSCGLKGFGSAAMSVDLASGLPPLPDAGGGCGGGADGRAWPGFGSGLASARFGSGLSGMLGSMSSSSAIGSARRESSGLDGMLDMEEALPQLRKAMLPAVQGLASALGGSSVAALGCAGLRLLNGVRAASTSTQSRTFAASAMPAYQPDHSGHILPHGGALVDLMVRDSAYKRALIESCHHKQECSDRNACDVELLSVGGFSPLEGFLNKDAYDHVVEHMRLPGSNLLLGLPVVLDTNNEAIREGQKVLLTYKGQDLAVLEVESKWVPNKALETKLCYGTTSLEHPGTLMVATERGKYYLGGKVFGLDLPKRVFPCATPAHVRADLPTDTDVVAFQCRNPVHRAHYELFTRALTAPNVRDGAVCLVHPTCGPTQDDDIPGIVRYHTYEVLAAEIGNPAIRWAYLPYSMHMAGPREAIQHMIIRKNYGCTHFIVGRDMAGSKSSLTGEDFYGMYDAQETAIKFAPELGMQAVPSLDVVYTEEAGYVTAAEAKERGLHIKKLSGTKFRQMLRGGEDIPEWFAFKSVVGVLREHAQGAARSE